MPSGLDTFAPDAPAATVVSAERPDPTVVPAGTAAPVELVIPGDRRFLGVVRLTASGVGALAGFDVERLGDLRLAVDELTGSLLGRGAGGPMHLSFEIRGGRVVAEGWTQAGSGPLDGDETERADLGLQILSTVADHFSISEERGRCSFRLEVGRELPVRAEGDPPGSS